LIDVLVVGGIFREVHDADTKPLKRYGGSGLSAAIAGARLGAQTVLAGGVGDEDEEAVRALLLSARVDDSGLVPFPGASGTFAFATAQDARHPWPLYRPAEGNPGQRPSLPQARVVAVFGIPDYDPVAEGWLDDIDAEATLLWDRQGWLSRARDARHVVALPPGRKAYVADLHEAAEDAGLEQQEAALGVQPPSGFQVAFLKRGDEGVAVFEGGQHVVRTDVPAFRIEARSTIGSGDVFAGVVAARLAADDSPAEAARVGCAMAAAGIASGEALLTEAAAAAAQRMLASSGGPE
jgi:sugar/nucleoside kinase (ribokinase family)